MVLALKDPADFKIPTNDIIDDDANFNYKTVDSINAYDRTYLDIINANRSFFFPPANVVIERSTDGGSTWTTVTTDSFSTENRGKMFSSIGSASLYIGTGNASLSQQLRVTMKSPGNGWYCSLDRAYLRWSNSGHSTSVTIQASTYGAQDTYTNLVGESEIAGWSGDNMYKFTERRAWGTNRTDHLYNIRFIFKYTAINSSYPTNQANLTKINMYGTDFWGASGTPRYAGHLYNWDYQQNVTFPANVTASSFLGNSTSSTYLLGSGRPTSADIEHIYTSNRAHQRLDLASNLMVTNKPASDGYINTYMWDNAGVYDAQFFMPNSSMNNGGRPQVRYNVSGTWSSWESLAKLSDVPSLQSIVDKIYPVGSIYMSATLSTASDVEAALGGTWVAWGSGRVPVGVDTTQTEFDTAEETGGYKETRHVSYCPATNSGNSQNAGMKYVDAATSAMNDYLTGGGSSSVTRSIAVSNLGGSIGDNTGIATEVGHFRYTAPNLQPYITCYMYKRTA
jgi:hypothetical protein